MRARPRKCSPSRCASQPDAFGELYARHFTAVYRYVAGRLGPDVADDLAAETFLAAIEVSYPGANGVLHFLLWVNAQTYLPLRMDKLHFLSEYSNDMQQQDFQFLPPTPANLAKVTVTVPPGYKRTAS